MSKSNNRVEATFFLPIEKNSEGAKEYIFRDQVVMPEKFSNQDTALINAALNKVYDEFNNYLNKEGYNVIALNSIWAINLVHYLRTFRGNRLLSTSPAPVEGEKFKMLECSSELLQAVYYRNKSNNSAATHYENGIFKHHSKILSMADTENSAISKFLAKYSINYCEFLMLMFDQKFKLNGLIHAIAKKITSEQVLNIFDGNVRTWLSTNQNEGGAPYALSKLCREYGLGTLTNVKSPVIELGKHLYMINVMPLYVKEPVLLDGLVQYDDKGQVVMETRCYMTAQPRVFWNSIGEYPIVLCTKVRRDPNNLSEVIIDDPNNVVYVSRKHALNALRSSGFNNPDFMSALESAGESADDQENQPPRYDDPMSETEVDDEDD